MVLTSFSIPIVWINIIHTLVEQDFYKSISDFYRKAFSEYLDQIKYHKKQLTLLRIWLDENEKKIFTIH